MRACLYCRGLLIGYADGLTCVCCGQRYTLATLAHYTNTEWSDLAETGRIVVSGELHYIDGETIRACA